MCFGVPFRTRHDDTKGLVEFLQQHPLTKTAGTKFNLDGMIQLFHDTNPRITMRIKILVRKHYKNVLSSYSAHPLQQNETRNTQKA